LVAVPALTVKHVRRGICHVTYTDGGVEKRLLRFVVRGNASIKEAVRAEGISGALESMPEKPGVYAVYGGTLGAVKFSVAACLHPSTASSVVSVASLLVDQCQRCPPGRARALIRRFNAAAYQVLQDNFPPIRRLARTLEGGPAAS